MPKERLDQALVARGMAESRERAKAVIMAGQVFVGGQKCDKPGAAVAQDAAIEVRGETLRYVSRGGLKLERALDYFGGDPAGLVCIDCGASTGGFTDLMLQRGAKHVYAVDVGYGQLAWSLRSDARVTVMERTNVRYLTAEQFPVRPQLGTVDVSFISLALILPALREVLEPGSAVFCLVKPQFEAGREKVGKKGVVREAETHREVLEAFLQNAQQNGFSVRGLTWSPIRGPEGNIEFLGYLRLSEEPPAQVDIPGVVAEAHERFRA